MFFGAKLCKTLVEMSFRKIVLWMASITIFIGGASALKDVSVTIPTAVRVMDTITLQCRFDLEGEPLYTLKWYKGGKEFYRYIPKEMPNTQVFPLPGINVDRSKSNPYEVVLRNVQPEATGKYKCEVSSDAPNFYTIMESAYLFVIDVPVDDPVMTVDKEVADVGSILTGNCSAPASYPAANVTWYLNGRKIPQSSQRLLSPSELQNTVPSASVPSASPRRTPMVAFSQLELEIDEDTFQNGKARLRCTGTIFHLYKREKEIVLEEERPRPKPSSVLGIRDAAGGSSQFSKSIFSATILTTFSLLR